MRTTGYLCIKKTGSTYNPKALLRVTKTSPALDFNEIAVKLDLELPDELFAKPRLEAKIAVPKEAVSAPVISAEVIDNVQDIIKQSTGFEVRLNLVEVEDKKKKQK